MKVTDSRFKSVDNLATEVKIPPVVQTAEKHKEEVETNGHYELQTRITFECAHRLYDVNTYSEECRNNLHGHSYAITLRVRRNQLNEASMVIDFKLLKQLLKAEIEDVYDHSCIIKRNDPLMPSLVANCKKVHVVDENPTAEWMSRKFANIIQTGLDAIDPQVTVVSVAVQETENNIAIYEIERY